MKTRIGRCPGWVISRHFLYLFVFLLLQTARSAQINTGSDGSDGPFNPTVTNTVINMADHPDGIYQYTSVSIPSGVTVTFTPNANNTPVVWLVQGDCVIKGTVDLSGKRPNSGVGAAGGPGGYPGGSGGSQPSAGQGPGAGMWSVGAGGDASYATAGANAVAPAGPTYGSVFLIPLLGGSGGGGGGGATTINPGGGGGGGGALLVAAAGTIQLDGTVTSYGGDTRGIPGGYGSGGAVRFVATRITGSGTISVPGPLNDPGFGLGRVRFDTYENDFGGTISGAFTVGFQPIIIPTPGQGVQLTVTSVGGVPVSLSPTGVLSTPDAVISPQQANPIPVVVNCSNLPLNTPVTVTVKPANGLSVSAVGYNNTGTLASSTATISINMPRGGGIIYATAATGN